MSSRGKKKKESRTYLSSSSPVSRKHELTCMDCKFCQYKIPVECWCKLKNIDLISAGYTKPHKCPAYQPRWITTLKVIFGYYK